MNPFDFARPVRDPAMFFGRGELRQEVLDGVRQGASFAIIGGTRIGKTSLLFQVRHALLEGLKAPQNTVIGPVFLSTHEFPRLSQILIYRRIIEEFRTTLRVPGSDDGWRRGVRLFDEQLPEDEAFNAFRQSLDTIFQSRDVDRRIVIMVDEVDELHRYDWSHSFFNNLRHLISQTPAGERIAIVIAGTLAIRSLYEVAGSPFLNVIQGTKTLELLSRAETEELVTKPTGRPLAPSIVTSIFFETGGHPFLTQYLMKHLCLQHGPRLGEATERDVQAIAEKYFDERTDFDNWVAEFTEIERQAYHRIASTPQGTTRAELVSALGDPKQVNHAIRLLIHIGVVREARPNGNRYLVGGDMFRRWFYDSFSVTAPPLEPPPPTPPSRDAPSRSAKPPDRVRLIRVFVASPGDVAEERRALDPVVAEINQTLGRRLQIVLDVVRWETDTYPGVSPGGPQAVIDSQIDIAHVDIVIGIFWRRFGTDTGFGNSGSAQEISRACELALRTRRPHVMVYFSDTPATIRSLDEAEQQRKLFEFKEQLLKMRVQIWTYESVPQFADIVRKHLTAFLQDHVQHPGALHADDRQGA